METIDIELCRIFIKVVQLGSFTKAAEALNLPKSTVSKSIARLESITSTQLLIRSTRHQSLTEIGQIFYDKAVTPLNELEKAQKYLFDRELLFEGTLRITAPEDLGGVLLEPSINELSRQNPGLSFDLVYSSRVIDLVKEGFDLAIRLGELKGSQLKVRRLGHFQMVLVASPEYLARHDKIKNPRDLENHDCLILNASEGIFKRKNIWKMHHPDKESVEVAVKSKIQCNQMTHLLRLAVDGAGIVAAPYFLCREFLQNQKLVLVLPQWKGSPVTVSLVSPLSMKSNKRLQAVIGSLQKNISHILEKNYKYFLYSSIWNKPH